MERKILTFFLITFCLSFTAEAQVGNLKKMSLGPNIDIPISGLSDRFDVGFGGSAMYQKVISDGLFWTINLGYMSYRSKTSVLGANFSYNLYYVPVKTGIKYFFVDKIYAGAELGGSFQSGQGKNKTYFAFAPALGTEIPISNTNSIDISVRFEGWEGSGTKPVAPSAVNYSPKSISFIGLRAAFNFVMGR